MLVILAIVMASAEAVMALGIGTYNSLATADVWTLKIRQGVTFHNGTSAPEVFAAVVMQLPAWAVFGTVGVFLAHVCRKRPHRRRIFRSARSY